MANSDYPRSHRVADQIQRDLAELLRESLKDPRVSSLVSIGSVDVTRDLSVAKVYVSTLGSEDRAELVDALKGASGFLRRELGKRLRLRIVPELRFFYDDTNESALEMDRKIREAIDSDRKNQN